jgi:hypothetical protein
MAVGWAISGKDRCRAMLPLRADYYGPLRWKWGMLYPAPCGTESLPPERFCNGPSYFGPITGILFFFLFPFSYLLSLYIFQIEDIF